MTYNASDPEALDLGFTLPKGTDLIRNGDDAITTNAKVATGAIRHALNRIGALEGKPSGAADHGALTGLGDDDHPQYLTTGRGDGRYAPLVHSHALANVAGLQSALDGKAATGHTHTTAEVTGLQAALDSKAATGHTHTPASIGAVPDDDPRLRDTGWRDLRSIMTAPEMTFTISRIRRVGSTVELYMEGKVDTARTSGDPILYVPAGFGGGFTRYLPPAYGQSSSAAATLGGSTGVLRLYSASVGSTYRWMWTWFTDDPWPTTLPGTPA